MMFYIMEASVLHSFPFHERLHTMCINSWCGNVNALIERDFLSLCSQDTWKAAKGCSHCLLQYICVSQAVVWVSLVWAAPGGPKASLAVFFSVHSLQLQHILIMA